MKRSLALSLFTLIFTANLQAANLGQRCAVASTRLMSLLLGSVKSGESLIKLIAKNLDGEDQGMAFNHIFSYVDARWSVSTSEFELIVDTLEKWNYAQSAYAFTGDSTRRSLEGVTYDLDFYRQLVAGQTQTRYGLETDVRWDVKSDIRVPWIALAAALQKMRPRNVEELNHILDLYMRAAQKPLKEMSQTRSGQNDADNAVSLFLDARRTLFSAMKKEEAPEDTAKWIISSSYIPNHTKHGLLVQVIGTTKAAAAKFKVTRQNLWEYLNYIVTNNDHFFDITVTHTHAKTPLEGLRGYNAKDFIEAGRCAQYKHLCVHAPVAYFSTIALLQNANPAFVDKVALKSYLNTTFKTKIFENSARARSPHWEDDKTYILLPEQIEKLMEIVNNVVDDL